MRMMFEALGKKLFGVRYERLGKMLVIYLIVFWGLHSSGFQIQMSPFILCLMVSTFTAGVMWQALSSEDHAINMMNLFMLPFERKTFIFAYVSVLGAYTLLIRTGMLFAVVFAISSWSGLEIACSILCACNAAVMTAVIYSWGKYWGIGVIWAAVFIFAIFQAWEPEIFLLIAAGNMLAAVLLLGGADAYSFILREENKKRLRTSRRYSVWRYLFRYLTRHKNYLVNTAIMWGIAGVLPVVFGQMEAISVMPVGFAILSLNTPVCILLSCDPALEQAVRVLPGQKRAFCIPYCLFIFLCNIAADLIYLCSWEIQLGGVKAAAILMMVFFALQSAVGSVLLEWFYPVRGWKIESDLWHHPRKYVMPVLMMLTAGMAGSVSWLIYILIVILVIESVVLFLKCQRC